MNEKPSKYNALSARCKAVFEALKKLAKEQLDQLTNGIFYASYPEIGKCSGYGRTATFGAVHELTTIGLIEKCPNQHGGKNGYKLLSE